LLANSLARLLLFHFFSKQTEIIYKKITRKSTKKKEEKMLNENLLLFYIEIKAVVGQVFIK
jgi:hypothetical protein